MWRFLSLFCSRRALLGGLLLVLGSQSAAAQLLPSSHGQAYDYLTLMMVEARTKNITKLLITPAFNGRSEIPLEPPVAFSASSTLEKLRHNDAVLTQSLSELSVAGWELIQVTQSALPLDRDTSVTRYLLRKARP